MIISIYEKFEVKCCCQSNILWNLHSYNTRHNQDIHTSAIGTTIEEQQINVKISNVWNNLPPNITNKLVSMASISKLKDHIRSTYETECIIPNCYIYRNQ